MGINQIDRNKTIKIDAPPSLPRQGRAAQSRISAVKFVTVWLFSVAGYFAAVLVNVLFPQLADVKIAEYETAIGTLTMNGVFRIVLYGLIVIYTGAAVWSFFDDDRRVKFLGRAPFRFATGIGLALWDVLGTKLLALPQPFFPGPAKILESFIIEGGYIFQNTLYSLRLFSVGFILGVVVGVCTGILIGWFPRVYYWVYPVLKLTGVIPAVAWMPFALTLFPTPFSAAAFLIVICAWFPVAFLTAQGISSTPKISFEAALTLGAKTPYLIFNVAIPHAMPNIFTGISTANGFAFTTLVMSEMMGQPGGLGYYINASKVWSAYYKVFASIIVMAILFSIIMKVIGLIQSRVLRWQRGLVK